MLIIRSYLFSRRHAHYSIISRSTSEACINYLQPTPGCNITGISFLWDPHLPASSEKKRWSEPLDPSSLSRRALDFELWIDVCAFVFLSDRRIGTTRATLAPGRPLGVRAAAVTPVRALSEASGAGKTPAPYTRPVRQAVATRARPMMATVSGAAKTLAHPTTSAHVVAAATSAPSTVVAQLVEAMWVLASDATLTISESDIMLTHGTACEVPWNGLVGSNYFRFKASRLISNKPCATMYCTTMVTYLCSLGIGE